MCARVVQGGRLKFYCVRTRGFKPHRMQAGGDLRPVCRRDHLAEWLRRCPAKALCYARESSNLSVVDVLPVLPYSLGG